MKHFQTFLSQPNIGENWASVWIQGIPNAACSSASEILVLIAQAAAVSGFISFLSCCAHAEVKELIGLLRTRAHLMLPKCPSAWSIVLQQSRLTLVSLGFTLTFFKLTKASAATLVYFRFQASTVAIIKMLAITSLIGKSCTANSNANGRRLL